LFEAFEKVVKIGDSFLIFACSRGSKLISLFLPSFVRFAFRVTPLEQVIFRLYIEQVIQTISKYRNESEKEEQNQLMST